MLRIVDDRLFAICDPRSNMVHRSDYRDDSTGFAGLAIEIGSDGRIKDFTFNIGLSYKPSGGKS